MSVSVIAGDRAAAEPANPASLADPASLPETASAHGAAAPGAGGDAAISGDEDYWREAGFWSAGAGSASALNGGSRGAWRDPRVWRERGAATPLALRPAQAAPPAPEPEGEAEWTEAYPQYPPGVQPTARLRPAALRPAVAPFESLTRSALVIDAETGEVLYQRGAYEPIHPASMTKIMTLMVALDAVAAGEIALDDPITVSRRAAGRPGSTMNLRAGQTATLAELLTGLMVVSGNDAAIAVAEAVAGGVDAFVARMNETAAALELEDSAFRNPSGLTAEGHQMSAHDIARLSMALIERHPGAETLFSRRGFEWRGARMPSTNPLMYADFSDIGVTPEGLKTGYTGAAGYCVAVSAVRSDAGGAERRVIAVLAGLPNKAVRRTEAVRVVRWAFDLL